MLLVGNIFFTLLSPTCGLMPREIDSRKRMLLVPILDCYSLKQDLKDISVVSMHLNNFYHFKVISLAYVCLI